MKELPLFPPDVPPVPTLAAFLRSHRREILDEWTRTLGRWGLAGEPDELARLDHLPVVLDRLAEVVEAAGAGTLPARLDEAAESHALHRLELGYGLASLVTEYTVLRDCLVRLWPGSPLQHFRVLNMAIDRAIAVAAERYQRALRESALRNEERLRIALQAANLGAWDWDLVTNTLVSTPELAHMFADTPGDLTASFDARRERIHPDDRAEVDRRIAQARAEHTDYFAEYRVLRADGSFIW